MSAHAELAPSSFARLAQCPGSYRMGKQVPPQEDTEETIEGTAAHWVALQIAAGNRCAVTLGTMTPAGVAVDSDMIQGADIWEEATRGETPSVCEERVDISDVHPQCWGTPDRYRYVHGVLQVADYKYGHKFVEVWDSWQLILYAIGVARQLDLPAQTTVQLMIVQPRNYHKDGPIRTWMVTVKELREKWLPEAQRIAMEALGPDPKCHTGPECEYCPARHACPTLQKSAMHYAEFTGNPYALQLSPQATGIELALIEHALERLEARRTGLKEQADMFLRHGQRVTGYRMEPGQSREKWNVPADQVFALGDMMGVSLRKPQEPITPTQTRALFKKIDPTLIDAFAARPPAAMKLTRFDDLEFRKIFSKGT